MSSNSRKFRSILNVGLLVALIVGLSPAVSHTTPTAFFDAFVDFSITANPNGAWSYGWTSTLGGPLNLYTITDTTTVPGIEAWLEFPPLSSTVFSIPNLTENVTDQIIESNGTVNFMPGFLSLHPYGPPGARAAWSVLQWTAPNTGIYSVTATFKGFDFVGPTTTDVHILVASASVHRPITPLLEGQINSYDEPLTANIPAVQVTAGDTISFVVGDGADYNTNFDTTGLKATIARVR